MNSRLFAITVVLILLATCSYPLYQMWQTQGLVFYTNAYDETSYLQYDYSKATQGPMRVSQYLVTALHELGLSGGGINLLFDLLAIPVCLLFLVKTFRLLGFENPKANLAAFTIVFLPLLFGGLNPWVDQFFSQNLQSGMVYWVSTPEASFSPLLRTPEPQFSLTILSVAVWWSIRKRSFWWLYPVLPFLYPFIAVPCGFVLLSLHLRQLLPWMRARPWSPPLTAFLSLASAMALYHVILFSEQMEILTVATREPMLSFTATGCLVIFALGYHACEPRFRYVLGVVALAPLAAINLQVISGRLAQPNGFEQYFGVICAAGLMVFTFDRRAARYLLFATSVFLALFSAHRDFMTNRALNSTVTLSDDLRSTLRTDAANVAVDKTSLASRMNMLYPRQASTRFGYERSFGALCNAEQVREYLRAKRLIQSQPELAGAFETVFETLDGAYTYQGADFILLHVGRKTEFQVRNKLERLGSDATVPQLHFVRTTPVPTAAVSGLLHRCIVGCMALIAVYPLCWLVPERYRLAVESKVVSFVKSTAAKLTGSKLPGAKPSGRVSATKSS